jgi:hypothetical protein
MVRHAATPAVLTEIAPTAIDELAARVEHLPTDALARGLARGAAGLGGAVDGSVLLRARGVQVAQKKAASGDEQRQAGEEVRP